MYAEKTDYDDIEINVFSCDRHNVCHVAVLEEGEA